MKKELKDKDFLKRPSYPGGLKGIQEFLRTNMVYPPAALDHQVEGTVSIRYTIDYQGKVIQVKILSGLGHGCDEEAERIVRLLKFEVAKSWKIKTQFHNTIHIHFNLPTTFPVLQPIEYTISKRKTEAEKIAKNAYHYQINW